MKKKLKLTEAFGKVIQEKNLNDDLKLKLKEYLSKLNDSSTREYAFREIKQMVLKYNSIDQVKLILPQLISHSSVNTNIGKEYQIIAIAYALSVGFIKTADQLVITRMMEALVPFLQSNCFNISKACSVAVIELYDLMTINSNRLTSINLIIDFLIKTIDKNRAIVSVFKHNGIVNGACIILDDLISYILNTKLSQEEEDSVIQILITKFNQLINIAKMLKAENPHILEAIALLIKRLPLHSFEDSIKSFIPIMIHMIYNADSAEYLAKIGCCSILSNIGNKLLEADRKVDYSQSIIDALNYAAKDRVLKVQIAASETLIHWNANPNSEEKKDMQPETQTQIETKTNTKMSKLNLLRNLSKIQKDNGIMMSSQQIRKEIYEVGIGNLLRTASFINNREGNNMKKTKMKLRGFSPNKTAETFKQFIKANKNSTLKQKTNKGNNFQLYCSKYPWGEDKEEEEKENDKVNDEEENKSYNMNRDKKSDNIQFEKEDIEEGDQCLNPNEEVNAEEGEGEEESNQNNKHKEQEIQDNQNNEEDQTEKNNEHLEVDNAENQQRDIIDNTLQEQESSFHNRNSKRTSSKHQIEAKPKASPSKYSNQNDNGEDIQSKQEVTINSPIVSNKDNISQKNQSFKESPKHSIHNSQKSKEEVDLAKSPHKSIKQHSNNNINIDESDQQVQQCNKDNSKGKDITSNSNSNQSNRSLTRLIIPNNPIKEEEDEDKKATEENIQNKFQSNNEEHDKEEEGDENNNQIEQEKEATVSDNNKEQDIDDEHPSLSNFDLEDKNQMEEQEDNANETELQNNLKAKSYHSKKSSLSQVNSALSNSKNNNNNNSNKYISSIEYKCKTPSITAKRANKLETVSQREYIASPHTSRRKYSNKQVLSPHRRVNNNINTIDNNNNNNNNETPIRKKSNTAFSNKKFSSLTKIIPNNETNKPISSPEEQRIINQSIQVQKSMTKSIDNHSKENSIKSNMSIKQPQQEITFEENDDVDNQITHLAKRPKKTTNYSNQPMIDYNTIQNNVLSSLNQMMNEFESSINNKLTMMNNKINKIKTEIKSIDIEKQSTKAIKLSSSSVNQPCNQDNQCITNLNESKTEIDEDNDINNNDSLETPYSCVLWQEIMSHLSQSNYNEAYQCAISNGDDILFLRLLLMNGNCNLDYLTNPALVKEIIIKMNSIFRCYMIQDNLVALISQYTKKGLFKLLESKEKNDIMQSIYEISLVDNSIGKKANLLYNQLKNIVRIKK